MTLITADNINTTPKKEQNIDPLIIGVLAQRNGGSVIITMQEIEALVNSDLGIQMRREGSAIIVEVVKA